MKQATYKCSGCAWMTKNGEMCEVPLSDPCDHWESFTRSRKDRVRHYTARQVLAKIAADCKFLMIFDEDKNDKVSEAYTRGMKKGAWLIMSAVQDIRRQMRRRK